MVRTNLKCLLICFSLSTEIAVANVGVFGGEGYTLELQQNASIRLTNEVVNFDFVSAAQSRVYPMNPNISGDHVVVHAQFTLENLSDSAELVQIGFPLTGESMYDYLRNQDIDSNGASLPDVENVRQYFEFTVTESGQPCQLRYAKTDSTKSYRRVFLWNTDFKPRETKEVIVSYRIELSLIGIRTDTLSSPYAKDWFRQLSGAGLQYFQYVTSTAKSWAGPPGKAKFRAHVAELKKTHNPSSTNSLDTLWTTVVPTGWRERDGAIEWNYDSFPGDSDIVIGFVVLAIPRDSAGLASRIAEVFPDGANLDDLSDFREIVAALHGIRPMSPDVVEFVKRQFWFNRQTWITEADLSPEGHDLLDYINSFGQATKK